RRIADVTKAQDRRRARRHEVDTVGDPIKRSLDVHVKGGIARTRTAKSVAGRNTIAHRRIFVVGQFCRSHQRKRTSERVARDINWPTLRCDGPLDELKHGVADRPVRLEKTGVNTRAALQGNEPRVHIRLPVQLVLGSTKYDDDNIVAFDDIACRADSTDTRAVAVDN